MTVTFGFSVSGPYVLLFCDAGPIIGAEGRCGQSLDIEEIALRAVSLQVYWRTRHSQRSQATVCDSG
jgi:hypothetical protein